MAENINYTSSVIKEAEPSMLALIKSAESLVNPATNPYQTYSGERIAQFSPLQMQSFNAAQGLGPQPTAQGATNLATSAGNFGMGLGGYQGGQFSAGMGPMQASTQSFLQPGTAGAYMNPYMQNVVDMQQRNAVRADDIARTQRNARAVGAGAFGGSRQAIQEAEAAKNLSTQLGDIQATGSNAAFQQAQQQFNQEQGLGLQALLANQRAGLDWGQQNLSAQQMAEQSRQFGSNLGLQGANLGLNAANTLGQIGQDVFSQQMQAAELQNKFGQQQRQGLQDIYTQQYNDFQAARDYPYQQLGFLSDILRGSGSTTRSMSAPEQGPSNLQTAAGLMSLYKGFMGASGGTIPRRGNGVADLDTGKLDYADGGIVGYADGGTTNEYGDEPGTLQGYRALQRLFRERADTPAPLDALLQPQEPYRLPSNQNPNSWLYKRDVPQLAQAPAPVPVAAKPAAQPVDAGNVVQTGDVKSPDGGNATDSASARWGFSAPMVSAQKPRTIEEMRAARRDAGVDAAIEQVKKEGIEQLGSVADLRKADAEQAVKDTEARNAKVATYGVEDEKRMKEMLGDLESRGKQAKSDAWMQAGLAILSAKPGGPGWRHAIAPIAEGAGKGLAGLRASEKELRKDRADLDNAMSTLRNKRLELEIASDERQATAKRAVRTAEIDAKEKMNDYLQKFGVENVKNEQALFSAFEKGQADYREQQLRADVTNATNRTNAGIASLRASGAGGLGGKPMTEAQRATAVKAERDALLKQPKYMGQPLEVVEAQARRNVEERRLRDSDTPVDSTGWGAVRVTP